MDDGEHFRRRDSYQGSHQSNIERRKQKKRKKRTSIKRELDDAQQIDEAQYGFENDGYAVDNPGSVNYSGSPGSVATASRIDVSRQVAKIPSVIRESTISEEGKEEATLNFTARSIDPVERVTFEEQHAAPKLSKPIIDLPMHPYHARDFSRLESIPGHRSYDKANLVRQFVLGKFKHRECNYFVRVKDKSKERGTGPLCECGREEQWHTKRNLKRVPDDSDIKWTVKEHTAQLEPNTFGVIHFSGFGTTHLRDAPYVRVDNSTGPENLQNVWELLSKIWHVPSPRLIISVTGGAKKFDMKERLKNSLKRGLIHTATTTGAWIVSGGSNEGVMQFVGEAVQEFSVTQGATTQQIVALGIATWGITDNKDALVDDECGGNFPAEYNAVDCTPNVRGLASLDPNHSHFILVDDGTERLTGREIEFRAAFERFVSENINKTSSSMGGKGVPVPVVSLVVEGGSNTLKTSLSAIKQGIPVVVVNGSGRVADYIAAAYKETANGNKIDTRFKERMREKAKIFDNNSLSASENRGAIDKIVENVTELMEYRDNIKLFSMDDNEFTNEVDQAILDALLNAHSDIGTQLELALAWNRCDVARERILTYDWRQNKKIEMLDQKGMLYSALFQALLQDKADFVQLFIDNGVDLKRFLDYRALRDLYHIVLCKKPDAASELLARLVSGEKAGLTGTKKLTDETLLNDVGSLIADLLDEQLDILYQGKEFHLLPRAEAYESYFGANNTKEKIIRKRLETNKDLDRFANPAHELFLWAVLLNRREMARFFWKIGTDHIGGALMAASILKSLAEDVIAEGEMELHQDMLDHANVYEKHAVGVLSECYTKGKDTTHQLLTRHLQSWNGATLLSLADSSTQMDFMGHTACQTKLNNIWMGRMILNTSLYRILLCMFLPFFLPIIKFQPGVDTSDHVITMDNIEEENGQKYLSTMREMDKETKSTAEEKVTFLQSIPLFYKSPFVKFLFHTLSYVIFLALFSFFVLVRLQDTEQVNWPSVEEFILWFWVFTLALEEFRQLSMMQSSIHQRVVVYLNSSWNRFDVIVYSAFLVSIILRFVLHGDNFVWARIVYCLTLMGFYVRFMQAFYVSKNIGPKVIMIYRMLQDLAFFICILLIFLLAYGVFAQALRFPNSQASWTLLKDVIYMPYWQMYGELFLEDLEGDVTVESNGTTIDCNVDPSHPGCPQTHALVIILLAGYMMISNVILLNLLVAMFSYTFENIQESSESLWRFNRYNLIHEYFFRPTLAPPLIVINHLFRALRNCCKEPKISHDFNVLYKKAADKRLTAFERVGMENYLHRCHLMERDLLDNKVQTTADRIDKVIEDLQGLKENIGSHASQMPEQMTDAILPSVAPPTYTATPKDQGDTTENDDAESVVLDSAQLQEVHNRMDDLEEYMQRIIELLQRNPGTVPPHMGARGSLGGSLVPYQGHTRVEGMANFERRASNQEQGGPFIPGAVEPYYGYPPRQMSIRSLNQRNPRNDQSPD